MEREREEAKMQINWARVKI